MKRLVCAAAGVALLVPAIGAPAVIEVGGYQHGTVNFVQTYTYRTSGTYVQHRFVLPTAYSTSDLHNIFHVQQSTVSVTDGAGAPMTWHNYPYNVGQVNSGTWIQVINPSPGTPFTYRITISVESFNVANFFGTQGDAVNYGHISTSYTYPSDYCDTLHPLIQSALAAAMTDPRWSSGTLPGRRGDLEKIALLVGSLTYASPQAGASLRKASEVWSARSGDCDDLVKLQCALHRRYGVPSRCVLSGVVPSSTLGLGDVSAPVLHAFGQYWTGDAWESYEPALSENFATANQVLLGADEDFSNLHPAVADPPLGYPTTLLSQAFQGNMSGTGDFAERGRREIGPSHDLYSQSVAPGPAPVPEEPSDILLPAGGNVGIAAGNAPGGGLSVRPFSQPAFGVLRLIVSGARPGTIEATLVDVAGRIVAKSAALKVGASLDTVVLPLSAGLSSGVYFAAVRQGSAASSSRIVYLSR